MYVNVPYMSNALMKTPVFPYSVRKPGCCDGKRLRR